VRVLLVHNSYRSDSPSGEQRVVDDESALLEAAGVTVLKYFRGSDEIKHFPLRRRIELPFRPIWSVEDTRGIADVIEHYAPDLLHVHNVYPLISPGVIRVADELGVPVVQTVHNYRHVCANGSYFRDGRVCMDCMDSRSSWPAVAHGCYRGSRAQSVVMATALAVHVSTWRRVRLFLPVTEFVAQHLRWAGIPPERIRVKPNSAADPGSAGSAGRSLLYVGRLSEEKGLRKLLSAWERSLHPAFDELLIAGEGPLRPAVEDLAARCPNFRYLGLLPRSEVHERMATAGAVVVPSLWFEGFPITVVEAFSHGRPVVATRLGSLGSVVDEQVGWTYPLGTGKLWDVLDGIRPDQLQEKGASARQRYLERYSPRSALRDLLAAYDVALTRAASSKGQRDGPAGPAQPRANEPGGRPCASST